MYVLNAVKAKELFQLGEERWHCFSSPHSISFIIYIYIIIYIYKVFFFAGHDYMVSVYMHLTRIRCTHNTIQTIHYKHLV